MSQLVHNNIHSCQKQIIVFLLLLDKNTVFHEYKGLNVKTLGIYALRWNKLFPVSVKWLNLEQLPLHLYWCSWSIADTYSLSSSFRKNLQENPRLKIEIQL